MNPISEITKRFELTRRTATERLSIFPSNLGKYDADLIGDIGSMLGKTDCPTTISKFTFLPGCSLTFTLELSLKLFSLSVCSLLRRLPGR